jgi:hypothetical protein
VTARTFTAAMALGANGLCLIWPSVTAHNNGSPPAPCIMAARHSVCAKSAACACAFLDGSRTILILDADLTPSVRFDPRPFCRKGEKPYGPAGPADPDHPYETCKPRPKRGR